MKISRPQVENEVKKSQSFGFISHLRLALRSRFFRALAFCLVVLLAFILGIFAHSSGQLYSWVLWGHKAWAKTTQGLVVKVGSYRRNGLPTLYIDMPYESYYKILEKREEALRIGVLLTSDEDMVPAQIRYKDGETLEVDMRLKGDWVDHLESEKWSYRIHVENKGQIEGMRRFSIQAPETRNFLNEWAFHQHLAREGVLSPRYQFVNVVFNGDVKGVYALEESFSDELLESQGRRPGVILRFEEDPMWENTANFMEAGGNAILDEAIFAGFFQITDMNTSEVSVFRSGHVKDDPALSAQARMAVGLLQTFQRGELPASSVFDVELMGRFYALSDLWGAGHTTRWHNIRFYYNPVTGLLEPIAYDAIPLDDWWMRDGVAYPFADDQLFDDAAIQEAYVRELERVTREEYLEPIQSQLREEFDFLRSALDWEYSGDVLEPPWDDLEDRRLMLSEQLRPVQEVRGVYEFTSFPVGEGGDYLRFDISNLMVLPVEVIGFKVSGQPIPAKREMITASTEKYILPDKIVPTLRQGPMGERESLSAASFVVHFPNGLDVVSENAEFDVYAMVRILGLDELHEIPLLNYASSPVLSQGARPNAPSITEALALHDYLSLAGDGEGLRVESGDWDVAGDLVLPEGVPLTIPPGTTLRFERGALLISTASVTILGTEEKPVTLTSQQESWGGVVVLGADNASSWEYARIENTAGSERSGWMLTGGITFYESPVHLTAVAITGSMAEDALNIIRSEYKIEFSEFGGLVSDAFDGDFTHGEIVECSFHDIGGDAVDISGSVLKIERSKFVNIADKALSAGEQSEIHALALTIESVGIGIASKDLSTVFINQSEIIAAEHAALAAYIKKSEYGPAEIIAKELSVQNTETYALAQTGSTIIIDESIVESQDFDVGLLYDLGILGN